MAMIPVVSVKNISKIYRVYSKRRLLSTSMLEAMGFGTTSHEIRAADNLSFEIYPGEVLGIIGRNGSGKSTILKVISGITRQDTGTVDINGNVTSLLELGAGLEPELTGYENIFLMGSLLGLTRSYLLEKSDSIITFSGLHTFIREPVKTYSSGMMIRLAFAVAAHSKPRLLILDEVLGVGDLEFQNRCFQFIHRSIQAGVAVVLVSHDLSIIGNFCDRVICLENGKSVRTGKASDVVEWYAQNIGAINWLARLQRPRMMLAFYHGNFHIISQGTLLTSTDGFCLQFWRESHQYSSKEIIWILTSQDPTGFTVRGRFPNTNLTLEINLRLREDRYMDIHFSFGKGFSEYFDRMEILITVSSRYRRYFTSDGYRTLPPLKTRSYTRESILMRTYPRRFIGLTGFDSRVDIPGLLADFRNLPDTGKSQIFNGYAFLKGRIISRSIPASDLTEMNFTLAMLPDHQMDEFFDQERDQVTLKAGNLEVGLSDSTLHFTLNGDRLTGVKGLFARWVEERRHRVEWEVLTLTPELHLRATDRSQPAVYCWTFREDNGGISWTLDVEILANLSDLTFQVVMDFAGDDGVFKSLVMDPKPEMDESGDKHFFALDERWMRNGNKPGRHRVLTGTMKPRERS